MQMLAARGSTSPLAAVAVGVVALVIGAVQWREHGRSEGHAGVSRFDRAYFFRLGAGLAILVGGASVVAGVVQLIR